jgi:hypothetical protein
MWNLGLGIWNLNYETSNKEFLYNLYPSLQNLAGISLEKPVNISFSTLGTLGTLGTPSTLGTIF